MKISIQKQWCSLLCIFCINVFLPRNMAATVGNIIEKSKWNISTSSYWYLDDKAQ